MERVTVRTYRENDSHPKRFGAHYERSNGERITIAEGERASQIAKDKAESRVHDCAWESFSIREDHFLDLGYGWIDEPEPD